MPFHVVQRILRLQIGKVSADDCWVETAK